MARLFAAVEPACTVEGDALSVLRAMLVAHARALLDNRSFENVIVQGVQIAPLRHLERAGAGYRDPWPLMASRGAPSWWICARISGMSVDSLAMTT